MIKLPLALLLLASPCFGQQVFRIQKFCEVGGQKVTTQGLNSVTNVQRSFPKCTVTVYLTGTTTIAAVYSDNLTPPTPLANPFTANVDGSWGFYASTATCYDVVTSGGNPGDTFPQPFTYSNICVGGGGGGTGVNPGTPYQVTRYDPTGVNIQDSTGSDNPANGPTRWVQGLSVEGNAGYRMFVNSSAGTTTNLLVCRDSSVTSITQVTTCPANTNSAFGLADNGAGTTGNVRTAMIGFHSCVFDNQTVVGDWVAPSATNAGQCTDAGGTKPTAEQVLGHVTTLNTGAATLATVDLFTGDTISGGGATVAIAPCTIAGCFAYYDTPNSIAGDHHTNLDGLGNGQLGSLGLTDSTHTGFWYETAGPVPPPAPTNSTLFYVDTTIATPNSFKLPKAAGAADIGKAWGVSSSSTDSNGNPIDIMGLIVASGVELQTNSVDNANCTAGACPLQNLVAGSNVTLTNTSGGNVTIAATGGLPTTTIGTPTAPTLANQNAAGARSITYLVQGCEDPGCVYHTLTSSTTNIANANASPQVLISAYGDTLYGPRCYDVYVTVDSGGRTLGLIAHCVGKKFIDTGAAGNGISATNTNTTVLTINMSPNPGCNIPPNGIIGVDAPPCSPNATDDEMQQTFGVPADSQDPFWGWLNQGSAAAIWSGGTLQLTTDSHASNNLELLQQALPGSTPYTYVVYVDALGQNTFNKCGIGFRESSTGKIATIIFVRLVAPSAGGSGWGLLVDNYAAFNGAETNITDNFYWTNSGYLKIQNTGVNIVYSFSSSGDGISYQTVATQAIGTPFTTGPNQLLLVSDPASSGAATCNFDYVRRTQ